MHSVWTLCVHNLLQSTFVAVTISVSLIAGGDVGVSMSSMVHYAHPEVYDDTIKYELPTCAGQHWARPIASSKVRLLLYSERYKYIMSFLCIDLNNYNFYFRMGNHPYNIKRVNYKVS